MFEDRTVIVNIHPMFYSSSEESTFLWIFSTPASLRPSNYFSSSLYQSSVWSSVWQLAISVWGKASPNTVIQHFLTNVAVRHSEFLPESVIISFTFRFLWFGIPESILYKFRSVFHLERGEEALIKRCGIFLQSQLMKLSTGRWVGSCIVALKPSVEVLVDADGVLRLSEHLLESGLKEWGWLPRILASLAVHG